MPDQSGSSRTIARPMASPSPERVTTAANQDAGDIDAGADIRGRRQARRPRKADPRQRSRRTPPRSPIQAGEMPCQVSVIQSASVAGSRTPSRVSAALIVAGGSVMAPVLQGCGE